MANSTLVSSRSLNGNIDLGGALAAQNYGELADSLFSLRDRCPNSSLFSHPQHPFFARLTILAARSTASAIAERPASIENVTSVAV